MQRTLIPFWRTRLIKVKDNEIFDAVVDFQGSFQELLFLHGSSTDAEKNVFFRAINYVYHSIL